MIYLEIFQYNLEHSWTAQYSFICTGSFNITLTVHFFSMGCQTNHTGYMYVITLQAVKKLYIVF